MTIIVDAFGADSYENVIDGIGDALEEIKDVKIIAVGDEEIIKQRLDGRELDLARLEIINATEVIHHDDSPVMSLRRKKDSSMCVSYRTLRDREDTAALLSAGNTGALIAGAHLLLGRRDGVDSLTLATLLPTVTGDYTLLTDCGANVDCRATHLLEFARLGSEYARGVLGKESPRVALLSVGTEDTKGNALSKEAFAALRESGLNFVGNIEAKTLLSGEVDVIVTDGFPGNVALKSVEGVASSVVGILLSLLKKYAPEGADLSFVKDAVGAFMTRYDFNSQGGAMILGAKKPVVKMHGSANRRTVVSSVRQAVRMARGMKAVNIDFG